MPTVVHFEIPSDDIERAKKFYSRRSSSMAEAALEKLIIISTVI